MKSLMLKLLIIALSVNILFAGAIEEKVLEFLSKSTRATKNYKIKDIKIESSQNLPDINDWRVYFIKIDLELVDKNRSITVSDKIFTNGKLVAKDLIDINTGRSIKSDFVLNFDEKFYNRDNIIAGEENAPNRLAIFSDPMCPFCKKFMPDIINFVNKHPKQFVLYYYHFPLNIYPQSLPLIKASLAAKKKGIKDVDLKVYKKVFKFKKTDGEKEVLKAFNKALKTEITLEEMNQKDVLKQIEDDMKIANQLGLNSAPRLFTNGKIDNNKDIYKKLLKWKDL